MGRKRKNIEDFILEATKIHNGKYLYDDLKYFGANIKTTFFCKEHGVFQQTPNVHLRGHGCPKCGLELVKRNNTSNTKYFINKASGIHNNKYDYTKARYVRNKDYITITCPIHGDFKQIARYHIDGNGCPECKESRGEKKSIEYEFQKKFND